MKGSSHWLCLFSCVGAFFASQNVLAHTLADLTKESETGISKYAVTCFNDGNGVTSKYAFQIKFISPTPLGLRLTVNKAGQNPGVTVDATQSGVFSAWGYNSGGDGGYVLTVTKIKTGPSAVGKIPFTIEHHCMAANGGHTGTSDTINISPVDPPPDPGPGPGPGPNPTPTPTPAGTPGFSGALNNKIASRRYSVECQAKGTVETSAYRFRIRGVSKKAPFQARMTVSTSKDDEVVQITDTNNTDKLFSDWVELAKGDGPYQLQIDKFSESGNTSGSLPFSVKHECVSDTGVRTRLKGPKKLP